VCALSQKNCATYNISSKHQLIVSIDARAAEVFIVALREVALGLRGQGPHTLGDQPTHYT
jgi:hypothetical protein